MIDLPCLMNLPSQWAGSVPGIKSDQDQINIRNHKVVLKEDK